VMSFAAQTQALTPGSAMIQTIMNRRGYPENYVRTINLLKSRQADRPRGFSRFSHQRGVIFPK
jgi:hypothetical protein